MSVLSFAIFLTIFSLILASGAYYIERGITREWRFRKKPPHRAILAVRVVLVSVLLLQWIAPLLYRSQLALRWDWVVTPIQWTGYLGLGFLAQVAFCMILLDIARATPFLKKPAGRRDFFLRQVPGAAIGTAGALSATGLWQARRGPLIRPVEIPLQGLPRDLEGLRIAQISDLHVGQTIRRPYVEEVVRLTMEAKPDLIVLTGDMVDGTVAQLENDVAPLARLEAPHGVYFVTGNHEYYSGALEWLDKFRDLGAKPLPNAHELRKIGSARLLVAGVNDLQAQRVLPAHRSDVAAALAQAPAHDVAILLAHHPKSIFDAEKHPIHLQLSGHTHAGQFFPITVIARFVHPYLAGLYEHRPGQWLYVNSGTGYWGPPNRFGTRAEITLIELKRSTT